MLAGRVVGRHVERLEVVPVGLDLGTLGDGEAQADEDVLEAVVRLGDEVEVAALAVGVEHLGEVEPLGREPLVAGQPARAPRGAAPRQRRHSSASPR